MSGVSNSNHSSNNKVIGNLSLNPNSTIVTSINLAPTTAAAKKQYNSNNIAHFAKGPQQQLTHQTVGNKLQEQQHHQQQRRSLFTAAQQLTQPQSVTTAAATAATTAANASAHVNQLQTVATIHHHHSHQQQQHKSAIASTGASATQQQQHLQHPQQVAQDSEKFATPASVATSGNNAPHSRRSFYHLQAARGNSNNLKAAAHTIPPRYQPPPQPVSSNGILKHLSNTSGERAATDRQQKQQHSSKISPHTYFADLNLKYPPDIPQLSTVYIPESVKGNATRYLHQQQQSRHRSASAHLLQEQLEQQHQDMLKFVRKPEQEHPSPNASVTSGSTGIPTATGRLSVEQNRQLQSLINELRALKEQNQRLVDDNQELRDLCCFLDDDRQKGRKLAREWQRFGRYTASVMRQEVSAYQSKLRQLDDKQQELITDNLELKELCLYLDEERAHVAANTLCANCGASTQQRNALRDDGDGSSSSTNADETITALRSYERQLPDMHLRSPLNDQTLQYVRSLEQRIQQLEEERLAANTPTVSHHQQQHPQQKSAPNLEASSEPISGRPEAVVRALQVLEVREQLERDRLGNLTSNVIEQMDDGEKALVREMCNVVWRKLEGSPNETSALEPL